MSVPAMDWSQSLEEMLAGYLGDQSVDEGAEQMVFVSEDDAARHEAWLQAIDSGIDAARRGEAEVGQLMERALGGSWGDLAEAEEYLNKLRQAYLRRYEAARGGAGS